LGQKSGAGFRKYGGKAGKPQADPAFEPILAKHCTGEASLSEAEITDRLFLPILLEATRVLEEGIVREPADVDMGLILGIGFPPYRGGILRWCDAEGAGKILERVEKYRSLGKRFEPAEMLRKLAQTDGKFYPTPKAASSFGGPSTT
jgi:3-hydroxyacyl-CoA dehydrogenase/enoyl-CoA hydratase/3-hydroxybutyryl-CoA epimerase/enoyl-CoA isomerase